MQATRTLIGDALVLRRIDYGEADRIVTLLHREGGKLSALARGARRSKRRFVGLELYGRGEARLRAGRGELWTLEGFDAGRGYPHLTLDVARVAHAAYGCELVRELLPPHQAEPHVFELLCALLQHLDEATLRTPPAHLRVFELALLDTLGFAPRFDRCAACDAGLGDAPVAFDPRRGVLCGDCAAGPAMRPLSAAACRLLEGLRHRPIGEDASLPELEEAGEASSGKSPDRGAWDSARDVLSTLLAEHLSRPLKSLEFIAKLNQPGPR